MDVVVREISESEKDQLDAIYSPIVEEEFPEYSSRIRDYFTSGTYKEHMLSKPIRLGAYVDNTLVGFLFADNPFGGVLFVYWLGVIRAFQGKGIGTKLLNTLETLAREKGAHSIQLSADKRNLPFYEHLEFDILGLDNKGHFGADGYIMRKLIQEPQEDTWFN